MPLSTGARLGPYEVLSAIGAGGMGEVYKARDTRLGRDVAIKVLPAGLNADPERRHRFELEARAVSALNHPHICVLHDVGSQDGIDFLVMEYLDGRTLAERLRKGPLPVIQVLELGAQIADALATAHRRGIVHRDLKPANIMLTKAGAKLLDFGLAKLRPRPSAVVAGASSVSTEAPATRLGAVMGTVPYMAPEQLEGKETDARTDLFAFGCVLYEMLTARRAFGGDTEAGVISAIMTGEPTPLSTLQPLTPPALDRLVRRCLAKDPDDRWQHAADVAEELRGISQDTVAIEGARTTTPRRRLRWLWNAAVGTVLIAGLSLVAWRMSPDAYRPLGRRVPSSADQSNFMLGIPTQVTVAPGWETDPALSPDGSLVAYTSNQEGDSGIWLTGYRGGTAVHLAPSQGIDEKPAWFPDGSAIAFASDRSGSWSIWKVPVLGGSAAVAVENARDPAISPDGARIAFERIDANGDSRIYIAPLADPGHAYRVTSGMGSALMGESDPAWSPDGASLCYAGDRGLWIVNAKGGTPRRLTRDSEYDVEPAWSSTDGVVYFSSFRGGVFALWQVSTTGGAARRLTHGPGPERHPSVSRDGRRLAFSTFADKNDLVLRDVRRGTEDHVTTSRSEVQPAFSHDGHFLVYDFDAGPGGGSELWLAPTSDGRFLGPPRQLTQSQGSVSHPDLSPDDHWVAYHRNYGGHRDIWIAPVAGGSSIQFTTSAGHNYHPVWNPAGGYLAFISSRDGTPQVWVAPVSDGHPAGPARRITSGRAASQPAWSSNGARIVYLVQDENGTDVWVSNADGTGPPRRVTTGARAGFVRWKPGLTGLIVSGMWGNDVLSLRRVNPATGVSSPLDLPVRVEGPHGYPMFDVSPDERFVTFSRNNWTGDIWVAEIPR
jgi:Tol biopolymer transport system component/predicted Ser/Thr protein kinase